VTGNYTYDGEDITNTTDLEVVPAEVDYVEITPDTDRVITAGDTIDFDAESYDQYENLVDDDDTNFTWQNTGETGLFDKTTAGEYDVTATIDEVTSPVTVVTVKPAGVDYVEITPDTDQVITAGDTIDFDAEAYDQYDNIVEDDDEEFTWQNTYGTGLFDVTEAGNYDVKATYDGVSSPITEVTVEPADVDYIKIEAEEADPVIRAGDTVDFEATAFDQYDNVVESDDAEFTWQNTDETGLFDNTTAGDYDVTATYDGESSPTTLVTVEPGKLESMEIVDYPDNLTAGESFQITIELYDGYGNLAAGGELENFTINSEYDGEVYSLDSVTFDHGLHVADVSEDQVITADDEHNITVSSNPTASIQIMIEPGDVDEIEIYPTEEQQVDPGEQVNFTAEAYDKYGNLITDDVTEFDWTNIDEFDEERNVAIFYQDEEGEVEVTVTYDGETTESTTIEIDEAPESTFGLSSILSSLWIWLVAVILILLIGGSYWRRGKKEVDEDDTSDSSVKVVRKKVKKVKKKPAEEKMTDEGIEEKQAEEDIAEEEEMSEETEEELLEEGTVEEEQLEEPTEEQVEGPTEEIEEETGDEVEEESTDEGKVEEEAIGSSEELSKSESIEEFQKVKGIGPATAENLYEENFETLEQLKEASVEELTEVKGIGESTAQKIFENLKE